jgi:hypothetical protein
VAQGVEPEIKPSTKKKKKKKELEMGQDGGVSVFDPVN